MTVALVRLRGPGGAPRWAVRRDDAYTWLDVGLADLLAMPLDAARKLIDQAAGGGAPAPAREPLAPVDVQEVWAAGVTYLRSRDGRAEESGHGDLYEQVYASRRPEIFFKASPWRVVGDGEPVGVRADSAWDVPEPELGLVVTSSGELFGYTLGNDMSSRSIEGENPLYLPQAKTYHRSCALGPAIVPAWHAGPGPFEISLRVLRGDSIAYAAGASTSAMARGFDDLVGWLFRALPFPAGVVLLTGTGVVPDAGFTTLPGDQVVISAPGLGTLTNPVIAVGRREGSAAGDERWLE